RDAQGSLDFRHLAHRQFLMDEDTAPLSEMDGETVWRQLSRSDKIVVLADGLEEALTGDPGPSQELRATERDNVIRLALRRAKEQRLPLVVTSRPDSALMTTEATIMELEPLGEETALDYIQHRDQIKDERRRIDWIVETADVTEAPLYLQIVR